MNRLRPSADLLPQSCGLKTLEYCAAVGDNGALRMRHTPCGYTKYSAAFDASIGRKISRSQLLPIYSELP